MISFFNIIPTILKYKGYSAKVELDEGAGVLQGEVIGTRDVITFQADSVAAIIAEFHASVDGYLDFCTERGEAPEKQLSGQFLVRSTPELHRRIHIAASAAGMSVNAWLTRALEEDTRELLESGAAGDADPSRRDEEGIPAGATGAPGAMDRPVDGESRRDLVKTGAGEKPGPAPDANRVLRQIADALEKYLNNLG